MATYPSPTLQDLTVNGNAILTNVSSAAATITGGTIDGTPIGATTPAAVHATTINSTGAATLASVSSANATLTGGTINGVTIGGTTPAAVSATNLTASGTVSGAGFNVFTTVANLAGTTTGEGAYTVGYQNPATGSVARTVQTRLQDRISVMDFGAVGDGVTDDSAAVQAAVNAAKCITIPVGKTVKCLTAILISTPDVKIYGPGTFVGQFVVAMPIGGSPSTTILAMTEFNGITFSGCTNPILCQRGRGILVTKCFFQNITGACALVAPQPANVDNVNHCVENLSIIGNFVTFADYLFQCDTSAIASLLTTNWFLGNGDTTISNNQVNVINLTHVSCDRADGLVITGNSFLHYGAASAVTTKRRCIEVTTRGAEIVISNNQLFEPGLEAIYLNYCFHINISGNNIVDSGEVVPSSAIFVDFSPLQDSLNTINSCGCICNNSIFNTSDHAIQLQNQSEIVVSGNAITLGNGSGYYYGTPTFPTLSTRFGINTQILSGGASSAVTVNNNPVYDNVWNQWNAGGSGTFYRDGIVRYTENATNTSLNGNYQQIELLQTSPTTVTNITGGYDGTTVILIAFNGNTTIGTTGNILTSTGANVALVNNGIYTLYKYNNNWYLK